MSHATIAISARTHKMKFGTLAYSFLQCSAKCFPTIKETTFVIKSCISTDIETRFVANMARVIYHRPVTTPRLAARD